MTPARWLLGVAVVAASCGSPGAPTAATTGAAPGVAARDAVTQWVGHLAARNDAAAFADLAPGSQAAVGSLSNYERGSGRFGPVYSRFAATDAGTDDVLLVAANLAVITLRLPGPVAPGPAAVPVRRVGGQWRVDPILDTGSYSLLPADGATVGPLPIVTVRLDDARARARVWFDRDEAMTAEPMAFRPQQSLAPGWHVATVVMLRGRDVVARTVSLLVS
jgi:hypothetical protein